jgi:uncharacterized Zn finger protein (UPF0148 family)
MKCEVVCPICLEEMGSLEKEVEEGKIEEGKQRESMEEEKLECGHAFHKVCIQTWFQDKKKTHCPICRKRVVSSNEEGSEREAEERIVVAAREVILGNVENERQLIRWRAYLFMCVSNFFFYLIVEDPLLSWISILSCIPTRITPWLGMLVLVVCFQNILESEIVLPSRNNSVSSFSSPRGKEDLSAERRVVMRSVELLPYTFSVYACFSLEARPFD